MPVDVSRGPLGPSKFHVNRLPTPDDQPDPATRADWRCFGGGEGAVGTLWFAGYRS